MTVKELREELIKYPDECGVCWEHDDRNEGQLEEVKEVKPDRTLALMIVVLKGNHEVPSSSDIKQN